MAFSYSFITTISSDLDRAVDRAYIDRISLYDLDNGAFFVKQIEDLNKELKDFLPLVSQRIFSDKSLDEYSLACIRLKNKTHVLFETVLSGKFDSIKGFEGLGKKLDNFFDLIADEAIHAETVYKLGRTLTQKGVKISVAYTPSGKEVAGKAFLGGFYGVSSKKSPEKGNTLVISGEGITAGDLGSTVIHELTHKFDEQLRLANLTQEGRQLYKTDPNIKTVYDVPADPEYFEPNFLRNFLLPLERSKPVIYSQKRKILEGAKLGFSEMMEELDYLTGTHEIFARSAEASYGSRAQEIPEFAKLVDFILDSSYKQLFTEINKEIPNIPYSLRYEKRVEFQYSQIEPPTLFRGLGGGGVNQDQIRAKLKQLIEQRLGQIFQSLSPEEINKAIDEIIAGKGTSGYRLGGTRFRTARMRQTAGMGGAVPQAAVDPETAAAIAGAQLQGARIMGGVPQELQTRGLKPELINSATQAIGAQVTELSNMGRMIDSIKAKPRELADGFTRLTVSLNEGKTRLRDFELFLKQTSQGVATLGRQGYTDFLKGEKAGQPLNAGQAVGSAGRQLTFQGLSNQEMRTLVGDIRANFTELQNLGARVTDVKTRYYDLADGTKRVTVSFKDGTETLRSYNRFIQQTDQGLKALSADQYLFESRQALSPTQLAGIRNNPRFGSAFAKAQQMGFTEGNLARAPETEASTGITRLSFQTRDADGGLQKLTMTVDRYGRVLMDTQKRFRDFSSAIARDIGEVFKWTVAVSLIYAPMRKLSELVSIAIENQAKLADVIIAVADSQKSANDVFNEAATVAQNMGESINGVLDGFRMAYAATANIKDGFERTAVANRLMADTLVLSKLSTLDQGEAFDILSGSLRQVGTNLTVMGKTAGDTNQPLNNGQIILDKWVATANAANVDLATLATSFSITSESAENAGISVDQLNGIVGALSEKIGGLGAKETGNAVRAIVGGVYQEGAAKALQTYGIAVTDTEGKMRDFLDIMQEIYNLNKQGLISDDQLNKLAYTLGGGVRRGQQYLAFLSDIKRVNELATVSAEADGNAQKALGIQLETVQTAVTRLGNAFQKLAQTTGTKGGFLDAAKGMIDAATKLTDVFGGLINALGKIGPAMALTGVAYLAMFRGSQGKYTGGISDALGGMLNLGGIIPAMGLGNRTLSTSGGPVEQTFGQRMMGTGFGQGLTRAVGGMLPALPMALTNLAQKDYASAGADMAGALVGTLATKGNYLGGIIGSAIGEFFVKAAVEGMSHEDTIQNVLRPTTQKEQTQQQEANLSAEEKVINERRRKVFDDIYNAAFGGSYGNGRAAAGILTKLYGLQTSGLNLLQGTNNAPLTQEQVALARLQARRESGGLSQAEYDKLLKAFNEIRKEQPVIAGGGDIKSSAIMQTAMGYGTNFKEQLESITKTVQNTLRQQLFKGELRPTQYLQQYQQTQGFLTSVPQLFTSMYSQSQRTSMSTSEIVKNFQDLAKVVTQAAPEEIQYVTQLSDEILQLQTAIEQAGGDAKIKWQDGLISADEATKLLTTDSEVLRNTLKELSKELTLKSIKMPSVVDLAGLNKGDLDKVMTEYSKQQEQKLQAAIREGIIPDERAKQDFIDSFDPIFIYLGKAFGYQLKRGITDPSLLQSITDDLTKAGEITVKPKGGLGFETFNVSNQQLQSIVAQSNALLPQLEGLGYQPSKEELITIDKNGIIDPMKADWKVVQYLLGQIADNTEKQLEGIYNMPEGANFWFPSSLLPLLKQTGAGGMPAMPKVKSGGEQEPLTPRETHLQQLEERINRQWEKHDTNAPQATPQSMQDILKYWGIMSGGRSPSLFAGVVGSATSTPADRNNATQYGVNPQINPALNPYFGFDPRSGMSPSGATVGALSEAMKNVQPNPINFKLDLSSTVQLVVDGRVLANVIKPYLTDDLLRAEGTTGVISKTAVI